MKRGIAVALLFLLLAAALMGCRSTPTTPATGAIKQLKLEASVDPFKPVIDLEPLGLKGDQIEAVKLERDGSRISHKIDFAGNRLLILDDAAAGAPVLDLNTAYTIKLFGLDNTRYQIQFVTAGLSEITETSSRQVVMVPAMPEKGFYWPYFLAIPSKSNRDQNADHKRYLMVDTTNTGASNNVSEMITKARTEVTGSRQFSMSIADQLGLPLLYPAFPRPPVTYSYQGENNTVYTHALDRDAATLHVKLRDPAAAAILTQAFQTAGFDVKALTSLDLQLNAMIDHAIAYLNQYGHKVEPKQVFFSGYSASGTFADRYAFLHPDRVKAVAAGAAVDDMALPLAQYKGQSLIFPIGTADYQEITGQPFDPARQNQVARLIYMGEDDTNNTLPYSDCYGERERKIITTLFGADVLPRAHALTKLYGESGGKGMIILDKGTQHGTSPAMKEYVKAFFAANRDTEQPAYPVPSDPDQLKYTLFK